MSVDILELKCRETCPFGLQCGRSYKNGKSPCVENLTRLAHSLERSLEEDPVLDPERPLREFSLPWIGESTGTGQLSVNIKLLNKGSERALNGYPNDPYDIDIGWVSNGYVSISDYNGIVYERVKDQAPVDLVQI